MRLVVPLQNPATGEIRAIKVGWSWTIFFFASFYFPLLIRRLTGWVVFFILMFIFGILLDEDTPAVVVLVYTITVLSSTVYLAIRGNKLAAQRLIGKGWVFQYPKSIEAQQAAMAWRVPLAAHADDAAPIRVFSTQVTPVWKYAVVVIIVFAALFTISSLTSSPQSLKKRSAFGLELGMSAADASNIVRTNKWDCAPDDRGNNFTYCTNANGLRQYQVGKTLKRIQHIGGSFQAGGSFDEIGKNIADQYGVYWRKIEEPFQFPHFHKLTADYEISLRVNANGSYDLEITDKKLMREELAATNAKDSAERPTPKL